jgi:hypothetical protein
MSLGAHRFRLDVGAPVTPAYCSGYWLSTVDIHDILIALLERESLPAPMPWHVLRNKLKHKQGASRVQIVNSAPPGHRGIHWLTIVIDLQSSARSQVVILEPLRPSPANKVMSALRRVASVQVVRLKHQLDAWSCGYYALWYQLELELGGTGRAAQMRMPPADWHQVVWTLLRVARMQEKHPTENALSLNLAPM